MICKKCGNEIQDDARFCSGCGAAISQNKRGLPTINRRFWITSGILILFAVLIFFILKGCSSGQAPILEFLSMHQEIDTVGEVTELLGKPDDVVSSDDGCAAYKYDEQYFVVNAPFEQYSEDIDMSKEMVWAFKVEKGGSLTKDAKVGDTFAELSEIFTFSSDVPQEGNIASADIVVNDVMFRVTFQFDGSEASFKSVAANIRFLTEESQPENGKVFTNIYGIYVTGNTELAEEAGNVLIEQIACPWESSFCYGYVFNNGYINYEGYHSTYSNVSVSVNEDPRYPYTGTILIQATRTTNGQNYSLTVTYDWQATDYGDYCNFDYLNEHIVG